MRISTDARLIISCALKDFYVFYKHIRLPGLVDAGVIYQPSSTSTRTGTNLSTIYCQMVRSSINLPVLKKGGKYMNNEKELQQYPN